MLEFQTAAYWAWTGTDRFGKPTYAAAIDISVRWEDVSEEFINSDGETVISRAKVYVDRDLKIKGVLLLDGIQTGTNLTSPKKNNGAWEIRRFDKLPTIDQDETPLRTVFL
jgi:hypothetical protein